MSKMTEANILEAIERALEITCGSLKPDALAENVEGWDSLGHLSILVALDQLSEGKAADITELADAHSVPKILMALKKHSLI